MATTPPPPGRHRARRPARPGALRLRPHRPRGDEQRGHHPAAPRAGRPLPAARARLRERAPRPVRGVPLDDAPLRGVLRHDRRLGERAEPALGRDLPEHHRGDQRRHVLAAHGVPGRRQRGDDDDGAQLQLRAVVRPLPRDPAPLRPARGVPDSALRPRDRARSTSTTWPTSSTSARSSSACTGASNFLGTQAAPGRRPRDQPGERVPPALGEAGSLLLVDAAQLVPSSAVDVQALDVDYLAFSFHKLLAPFGVGVLIGKEHLLAQGAAVPLRRRHDRRGPGGSRTTSPTTSSVEVRGRHAEHPRRDRLRAGPAPGARPGARRRRAVVPHDAADPSPNRRGGDAAGRGDTPAG